MHIVLLSTKYLLKRNARKSEIFVIDEDDLTLYTQGTRFAFWKRVDNWKNWVKSPTIKSRIRWSECVEGGRPSETVTKDQRSAVEENANRIMKYVTRRPVNLITSLSCIMTSTQSPIGVAPACYRSGQWGVGAKSKNRNQTSRIYAVGLDKCFSHCTSRAINNIWTSSVRCKSVKWWHKDVIN